ncbi:hypothetical protein [Methanobacterium petrolearium]|uniref:hypothetical protein n=1 Tax=Methanobacterium petrolearium TaxID=710190 RepID=UPI0030819B98
MKLVKSQVKCYKKKTKKNVGGQKKTYEYNQYLVPLKRADNLDCSMDVFIIPQSDLNDLIDEKGELKDISGDEDEYKRHLAEYEAELADLEWKHSQLSKSYKELFKKHNKIRKKNQELENKVESLGNDREKLISVLKKVKDTRMKENTEGPKTIPQKSAKQTSSGQVTVKGKFGGKTQKSTSKADKTEINPDKKGTENKKAEEIKENRDDKDIWTVLRSRLTKKEEDEK